LSRIPPRPRERGPDRSQAEAGDQRATPRSNDAIHLAVALKVGADEIVTYDGQLIEQATAAGLTVVSPAVNSHL
jgi:predicted nucleic acid-binding protein